MNAIARLGLKSTHPTNIVFNRQLHIRQPPRIQAHISASRDEGVSYAARIAQQELCVYTDGSAFRGGVGGAARAITPAGTLIMREHLGKQRCLSDGKTRGHLAVEGEMLGIILGLKIINTFPSVTHATVLVDCQQAIFELVRARSKYGYLFDRFHEEARTMDLRRLRLAWVPGHEGVEMNELVDGDAKAAALGESGTILLVGGVRLCLSPSLKFV